MTFTASGRTLWVGPNEQYQTLSAAIAASQTGDTINVRAGVYENDFAIIRHDLHIVGVGGKAHLKATKQIGNDKGILVVGNDADLIVENMEFSGATVRDGNGAGIRHQGEDLTVKNSYFHDNQEGILTSSNPESDIIVQGSEFANNGEGSDGKTHGLYATEVKSVTVTDSYFHDTNYGSHIKSRALHTLVENNRLIDGDGTASYSIDLSSAHDAVIRGNHIEQGEHGQNKRFINYGSAPDAVAGTVLVEDNVFINRLAKEAVGLDNRLSSGDISIVDNTFVNVAEIARGPHEKSGNERLTLQEYQDSLDDVPPDTADPTDPTDPDPTPEPGQGEAVTGGSGDDRLYGGSGDDHLIGGAGRDRLYGKEGSDTLQGGAGRDDLYGGAGDSSLDGGDGDDKLVGGEGVDQMLGGAGDDRFWSGPGDDVLHGGAGEDQFWSGDGQDSIHIAKGEADGDRVYDFVPGQDVLVFEGFSAGASFTHIKRDYWALASGDGQQEVMRLMNDVTGLSEGTDYLFAQDGANDVPPDTTDPTDPAPQDPGQGDVVTGSSGDDRLYGGSGDDALDGGAGEDQIWGRIGDDELLGGDGRDRLHGEGGADTLQGGAGHDDLYGGAGDNSLDGGDTIHIAQGEAEGDRVYDFAPGQDVLIFEGFGAGASFAPIKHDYWALTSGDGQQEVMRLMNDVTGLGEGTDYLFA